MRQYRGLTKEGKWVYGFHYVLQSRHFIIPSDKDIDIGWTDTDFVESFIEVIPETVGQSTGLKDKFGTEIYDGDIIKTFVLHKTPTGTYDLNVPSDIKVITVEWLNHITVGFNLMNLKKNKYEIIGNRHQNPELLKGES